MTCSWMKLMSLSLMISGLSACGSLYRTENSGYADGPSEYRASAIQEFYREKHGVQDDLAREELGLSNVRELNEGQRDALTRRLYLKRLEAQLETRREKKQYYKYKGLIKSDGDRIYFLKLPSVEARERWAQNRGYVEDEKYTDELAQIIEKNDIAVGMSQKAVVQSWGDPDIVEVAGDPVYGNERWRYSKYESGDEGFNKQTRVVYFESGRVVGWETY